MNLNGVCLFYSFIDYIFAVIYLYFIMSGSINTLNYHEINILCRYLLIIKLSFKH